MKVTQNIEKVRYKCAGDGHPGMRFRFRFRRLMVVTTGLTFVLMLLGIYTAAFGAGLTCGARWPFCDGWLGLFPANIPSFIEWFHRLVAMITGFVILGTTYSAWKHYDDRRVTVSLVLAVLLLPIQIALGAVTVTLGGMFPWGYAPIVQISHYTVALAILALLTIGSALSVDYPSQSRLQQLTAAALVLLPIQYLFSYDTLFAYSAEVQIVYYALSLGIFGLLVSIAVWAGGESGSLPLRGLSVLGSGLLVAQMLLGRRLWGTVIPPIVSDVLSLALLVVLLLAVWFVFRGSGPTLRESADA
jgi:cytochrome c oxidase assembly protein subunit 15